MFWIERASLADASGLFFGGRRIFLGVTLYGRNGGVEGQGHDQPADLDRADSQPADQGLRRLSCREDSGQTGWAGHGALDHRR